MKPQERTSRVRSALRSIQQLVFLIGLGIIVGIMLGPKAGVTLGVAGRTILQLVSKTVTRNWYPDRFERSGLLRYDPARAQPGYTLYTLAPDLSAHLIDMNGREVHSWFVPNDQISGVSGIRTLFGLLEPQVEGGYLYPDGDVILVYEVKALTQPATRLFKLDKDSHVLWKSNVNVHHAIEIAGDKIYALTSIPRTRLTERARRDRLPRDGESISILGSDGKVINSYSIINAIANATDFRIADFAKHSEPLDPLHSNSLDVLTEQTARFFPGAKPGNVLVSLRNLDLLTVMDLERDTVVWAMRGGWRRQHDAKVLPNGHILMFDNNGGVRTYSPSRILEIDPATGGIVWSYSGKPDDPLDSADNRGGAQRLANGNTLINEANAGRIIEVTPDGTVVWEYVNPLLSEERGKKIIASFGLTVTRYDASYLSFLGGHVAARGGSLNRAKEAPMIQRNGLPHPPSRGAVAAAGAHRR